MGWNVRRLEDRDKEAFLPFLARWLSDRPISEHFNWLYRGNPHGDAITWIAVLENDNRIVGCTSTFPRRMRIDGETVLGSFGGDAFVDPDFRRRGIAQSLHEYCSTDMQRLGIECLYGFPVPANLRAFLRAGALNPCNFQQFQHLLHANTIMKPLGLRHIASLVGPVFGSGVERFLTAKLFRKPPPGSQLRVVDAFDEAVDELFDSVADRLFTCCVRDAEYLNWRFARHPHKTFTLVEWRDDGRLLAYAVLNWADMECRIVDFIACDTGSIGHDFLASLAGLARDNGKWSLVSYLNGRGPEADLFRRSGFIQPETGRPFMVHTIHDPQRDRILGDPEKWFLMSGDDDVAS